jgi:hypothetical protein
MATTSNDGEVDAGNDTTASLRGTPGYDIGSPLNPTRIIHSMSPSRNTSDLLRPSGIPGMNDTGFSPFAQSNDSVRPPDIFGITDSPRRSVTAKGMVELMAESISKDDMRQVVIDRLNKAGGLVDSIRIAGFESLEASPTITDKAKIIFENIMVNIQVKCADIFQEVLAEIFDMMAPKMCSHFSLVQQTAETSQLSPAKYKYTQTWKKLLPLYESLYENKKQIEKCRQSSTAMLTEIQMHEQEKEKYLAGSELAFMFEEWTTAQFATAGSNLRTMLKQLQIIDSQITMYDIVSNTCHLEVDWSEIAKGTGHDADEVELKMVSKWRDSQITILNNGMKGHETRTKLLTANQNAIIGEIARLDVKSADSYESIKDPNRKPAVLVLQKNALIGPTKSPKVLLVFVKALNTFFDLNPGKYAVLRMTLKYLSTEIQRGRTTVEFPMARNHYDTGLQNNVVASHFLQTQSEALVQTINATADYSGILSATKEQRVINENTKNPELFAANIYCFMEVFRWIALHHGGQSGLYRRQLKVMLENLGGLLSQKKCVDALRQVLKDVIMPAKKLDVKLNWQDVVWPIIKALRSQSNTIFVTTIAEYEVPTEEQAEDCIKVLEDLLSRLVSVLETAHMEDKVLIDSTTFTNSVEAATFNQAYINLCETGGEAAQEIFVLQVDSQRSATPGGPPKKKGARSTDKAHIHWNELTEAFLATNPSQEDKIKWTLSAKCGQNHQQHVTVESLQSFANDTWTCGEVNCKGHVSGNTRLRLANMRLNKHGLCCHWTWGLCDMHSVENILKDIIGKYNFNMDKMNPKRGAWLRSAVMKGSLGQDVKDHLMRLDQEAAGGSPMTTAPAPLTYAAAAGTSASVNAAGPGVPPAVPVVASEDASKDFVAFALQLWNSQKTSDGSANAGAVSIDGPRPASSMSPGMNSLFQ